MTKWPLRISLVGVLLLSIAGGRLGLSYVRPHATGRLAALAASVPVPSRATRMPEFFDGNYLPPAGTDCSETFVTLDSRGDIELVPDCSCFASVNYLLTGDPTLNIYHAWPVKTFDALDRPATWDALESSLRPGDVVEFTVTMRPPNGGATTGAFHVQLCVGPNAMTAGANNTPAFSVVNGIPGFLHRWDHCTPREFYIALRHMDGVWQAAGYEQRYGVRVYQHPG